MPVYEYRCAAGHTFERIVSVSNCAEKVPCLHCHFLGRKKVAILQISQTAPPKFKKGVGGFYAPTD